MFLNKQVSILLLSWIPLYTYAFNGVYLTGSGQISSGMGGVSLAHGVDRMSMSDNPANLALQASGVDAQVSVLNIKSRATLLNQVDTFKSNKFIPIPSLAIVQHHNDQLSYGLSMTGAGAAVDYGQSAIQGYHSDKAKDNLAIGVISPTISYQILPNWSVGASLNIGVQQFRAKGVLVGADDQGTPVFLPSHGNQWAYGIGGSLGTTWEFKPNWWLGASYVSELHFSKLDQYKDDLLKSSQGRINLPEHYGMGIQHQFNDRMIFAADILRFNWKDADGLGEKGAFNWKNQTVYRAGVDYKLSPKDHVRFGYSYANSVVDSDNTLVNFYANAIAHRAWTVGFGHTFDFGTVNIAYEYALNKKLTGTGESTTTNLSNKNHVVTIGMSKSF